MCVCGRWRYTYHNCAIIRFGGGSWGWKDHGCIKFVRRKGLMLRKQRFVCWMLRCKGYAGVSWATPRLTNSVVVCQLCLFLFWGTRQNPNNNGQEEPNASEMMGLVSTLVCTVYCSIDGLYIIVSRRVLDVVPEEIFIQLLWSERNATLSRSLGAWKLGSLGRGGSIGEIVVVPWNLNYFCFGGMMDSAIDRREREFDMWEGFTLGIHVS